MYNYVFRWRSWVCLSTTAAVLLLI